MKSELITNTHDRVKRNCIYFGAKCTINLSPYLMRWTVPYHTISTAQHYRTLFHYYINRLDKHNKSDGFQNTEEPITMRLKLLH